MYNGFPGDGVKGDFRGFPSFPLLLCTLSLLRHPLLVLNLQLSQVVQVIDEPLHSLITLIVEVMVAVFL